eukprot:1102720-Lingulodinium_polyedra.AAC.1
MVLEACGVCSKLVQLIHALYTGQSTRLGIKGLLGPIFMMTAGVRQGCPLSAALFVLCMDPLV